MDPRLSVVLFFALILFVMYMCFCSWPAHKDGDNFYIPQNIVGSGDFHIEAPGSIADSGNVGDDMMNYMAGDGPI